MSMEVPLLISVFILGAIALFCAFAWKSAAKSRDEWEVKAQGFRASWIEELDSRRELENKVIEWAGKVEDAEANADWWKEELEKLKQEHKSRADALIALERERDNALTAAEENRRKFVQITESHDELFQQFNQQQSKRSEAEAEVARLTKTLSGAMVHGKCGRWRKWTP